MQISIHAPTRGATFGCHINTSVRKNFNPRSHEGSDSSTGLFFSMYSIFQSTLPRGERPASRLRSDIVGKISIHAPTRGATEAYIKQFNAMEFQSTLPRGERPGKGKPGNRTPVFQSTLPRGERRSFCNRSNRLPYFNPRSHEGSDKKDA